MLSVDISFNGTEEDGTLYAVIYNPAVLPTGLHSQIKRYGLTGPSGPQKPLVSGTLNGSRKALTELIQTYGLALHVVPFEPV